MKNDALMRLREAIRDEFRRCFTSGKRARTSDIANFVRQDHPELVAELGEHLITKQLSRMCSDEAKSWGSVAEAGARQIVLPGMDEKLSERLPPAISVPIEGNSNDIEFIPAQTATLREWRLHTDYMRVQYRALGMNIIAAEEVIERGERCDCPEDGALLPWVAANAGATAPAK